MINIYKSSEFAKILGGRHYFLLNEYNILYWKEEEKEFVIANIDPEKTDYSLEDYLKLPDYAPYQLINGKLIFMPAPIAPHQKALAELHLLLGAYVKKNKLGAVYFSPIDVVFDENNVLQPDLLFVAVDRLEIIENRVNGSPDLAVEVLSSNSKNDLVDKMQTYAKFGVLEYWIIDLKKKKIEVYENQKKEMVLIQTAFEGGSIKSKVIRGFVLELNDILG